MWAAGSPDRQHGFTLIELLVVLVIVAFASVGVSLAMRDSGADRLQREAQRLAAVLEATRAQAQAMGVPLRWSVTAQGFRIEGWPTRTVEQQAQTQLAEQLWLDADTQARVDLPAQARWIWLGPEPMGPAQGVTLFSRSRPDLQVSLRTDGLRPFAQPAPLPSVP